MKITIILPVLIWSLLSIVAFPMNDTDGVCGKGLFPLGLNAKFLLLSKVSVDVTLTKRGTLVKRTYEIRNVGKGDTFTFGAVKCYNCVSEPEGGYLRIKVNGKAVKSNEHLSFLRDSGAVVTRRDLALKDARQKLASLDGTIETHVWVSFRMQMPGNATKTIEVEYLEHPVESYFTQTVVGTIYLYTEKFWAGDSVPFVEVRFNTEQNFIPIDYFVPSGEAWDKTSIKPDTVADNQLIWKVQNYRPKKTMYSYTLYLLHPYAVKRDLITEAFSKATGIRVQW